MKKVQLSKFLTQKQITRRGQKSKKTNRLVWNESVFKIGLLGFEYFFSLDNVAL